MIGGSHWMRFMFLWLLFFSWECSLSMKKWAHCSVFCARCTHFLNNLEKKIIRMSVYGPYIHGAFNQFKIWLYSLKLRFYDLRKMCNQSFKREIRELWVSFYGKLGLAKQTRLSMNQADLIVSSYAGIPSPLNGILLSFEIWADKHRTCVKYFCRHFS